MTNEAAVGIAAAAEAWPCRSAERHRAERSKLLWQPEHYELDHTLAIVESPLDRPNNKTGHKKREPYGSLLIYDMLR